VIVGGWSNGLPLAKVDKGKGDGGLVVRRTTAAVQAPLGGCRCERRGKRSGMNVVGKLKCSLFDV